MCHNPGSSALKLRLLLLLLRAASPQMQPGDREPQSCQTRRDFAIFVCLKQSRSAAHTTTKRGGGGRRGRTPRRRAARAYLPWNQSLQASHSIMNWFTSYGNLQMQYTGTVAMFNSLLRRDGLGGLREERRPANNIIQYDLPREEKTPGAEPPDTCSLRARLHHATAGCWRRLRRLRSARFAPMHYYYYYYGYGYCRYAHAPW